ncbi:MarR family winged helix-turn-helix transcriptional regulator [Desulfosporosinus sp. BICA1-9]|uniref:MarR family winged helix-turn-helix transcriptional regulator n=1 Tax=Desulfosporosinus sp. BICA1-9 TaxID=1531958 RepID=UPI00054B615C|nr:MarR family transcriptional regulator [Desulfosporosinus sp. BICA1-9]KJS45957.1 MAG: TrmB family transcriptional regulator [Peptococcaceae bacterium BRH_c23]KJS90557.1 MAG: TrmB family transcriptional regulator [Desulfosporosinus sp. BICA1-9]HBW36803.1 MarR family transcriptional regulator [Desulfosporosinus sp.]
METINESAKVANLFQEVMILFKQSMSKVFEDSGITAPQGMVLRILSKETKIKITELSSKLSLPNSTVSGIVDRLEKQGMVERERSEKDRRIVYVKMSPNFKEMHQHFHKNLQLNIKDVMNKGTPEDLEIIFEGLSTLKKLLRDKDDSKC